MKAGDKVRCIKTVIMKNFDQYEAFTKGKWYEITGETDQDYKLRNNKNCSQHHWPKDKISDYFATAKRRIDVAIERTGMTEEQIIPECPASLGIAPIGIASNPQKCIGRIKYGPDFDFNEQYKECCTACWTQLAEEEKPMFKPGDKARVRSDLVVDNTYGGWKFTSGMDSKRGQIVEITEVRGRCSRIKGDDIWEWAPEMLEPVNMVHCAIKDCEKNDNGHCQTMYDELIRLGVGKEDVARLNFGVGCVDFLRGIYKKRENHKESWESALNEKFEPIHNDISALLTCLGKQCAFCRNHICENCPWEKVFGKCVNGASPNADTKYGQLINSLNLANRLVVEICNEIREQIDKC